MCIAVKRSDIRFQVFRPIQRRTGERGLDEANKPMPMLKTIKGSEKIQTQAAQFLGRPGFNAQIETSGNNLFQN